MTRPDWDARWLELATLIASWSKDRSTKVGCVVIGGGNQILTGGYNGFPRGVNDDVDDRHERPAKYKWTEHAERNAIYNAARYGIALAGTMIYIPWYPCTDCARGIIQAGIKTVIAVKPDWDDPRWGPDFLISEEMMSEAGVAIRLVPAVRPLTSFTSPG